MVEKRRLSDIGSPDDGSSDPLLEDPSFFSVGEKSAHLIFQALTGIHEPVGVAVPTVILGIVQCGLYKSDLIEDLLPELFDPGRDRSFQLSGRSLSGEFIAGGNQIHDCFRPGQVDPSAKECSLCKLAGLSHSCSALQN